MLLLFKTITLITDKMKNNSKEMATAVETFLVEETTSLVYDNEALAKWNEQINELGLTGQTKIVKNDKSPIPFLYMKKSIVNILKELCPRESEVSKYNADTIPMEILDLIALSKREGYFDSIHIWYDEKTPDPVCVGQICTDWYVEHEDKNIERKTGMLKHEAEAYLVSINNKGEIGCYDWGHYLKYYLIGKWGDVKRSFEELKEMATKRYIARESNEFKKRMIEAKRGLEDVEIKAFEAFN